MFNYLVRTFLFVLSFRAFSRLYGFLVRLRHPRFLIRGIINLFKTNYGISMEDYQGEAEDYQSLSGFFTRPLDPAKRPLKPVENAIVSPADGVLTGVQTIDTDEATQVKGKTYPVSKLIGTRIDFSKGWQVAVIYLSPSDYHRFHYPFNGKITRYLHTGTRLFPVNNMGLNYVDELFVRNERIVVEFETPIPGLFAYVAAVGATFVGSTRMEFIKTKKSPLHQWIPVELPARQMDEMGRFEMGSTIVLAIPKQWAEPIKESVGQPVKVGQPIFSIISDKMD